MFWAVAPLSGGGHFVKMVHNEIEYGITAAYGEGLKICANAGTAEGGADAAPLRQPELYQYDLNFAEIAEAWWHGSVIGFWLLDLTAATLKKSPELSGFAGHESDPGERSWTLKAAIDEGVPVPVSSTALAQPRCDISSADTKRSIHNAGLVRCPRLLRCDRRPRAQERLPDVAGDGKRGHLNVPVIGVAKVGRKLGQRSARATESPTRRRRTASMRFTRRSSECSREQFAITCNSPPL
jgi:6-phosphogluconate dehydrogenase